MHRTYEKCVQGFGQKLRDHLEGIGVDGRIILKHKLNGGRLRHDRYQLLPLMNMIKNLWVPQMVQNFLSS
jgi:hypothetical protein